jgi:hypothetical protein
LTRAYGHLARDIEASIRVRLDVHEDAEGRTALSFPVEAASDRQALDSGRELASTALADHPVVWTVGGITHWVDDELRPRFAQRGGEGCRWRLKKIESSRLTAPTATLNDAVQPRRFDLSR